MLHLHTFGTTQRIGAATLVQAATLGEGIRDFLADALLHVTRHERPPLASPDRECQPPKGTASGCAESTGGNTLSDMPSRSG